MVFVKEGWEGEDERIHREVKENGKDDECLEIVGT